MIAQKLADSRATVYELEMVDRDGHLIPLELSTRLIYEGGYFRREFMGVKVPRGVYIHVCGTDLIRDTDCEYLVLEANGRTPSGMWMIFFTLFVATSITAI